MKLIGDEVYSIVKNTMKLAQEKPMNNLTEQMREIMNNEFKIWVNNPENKTWNHVARPAFHGGYLAAHAQFMPEREALLKAIFEHGEKIDSLTALLVEAQKVGIIAKGTTEMLMKEGGAAASELSEEEYPVILNFLTKLNAAIGEGK